jgi:hypothetical protein
MTNHFINATFVSTQLNSRCRTFKPLDSGALATVGMTAVFALALGSTAGTVFAQTPIHTLAVQNTVLASPCNALGKPSTSSTSIQVSGATYLGLGTRDVANAVEIAPDCTVLVAGQFGSSMIAGDTINQGTGGVLKLSPNGQRVTAVSRVGVEVSDMAVRQPQGDVAVASNLGVKVMAANLTTTRWQVTNLGAAQRVDMAADGSVAALFGKTLRVYDVNGKELFKQSWTDSQVNDVAIDSVNKRVVVTGFAQRDKGICKQLQVAWVRAYDMSGKAAWTDYDWTHAQAGAADGCADTRGSRVSIGRDGKLYFAGMSSGGNTIFNKNPKNLKVDAPNVKFDAFNNPYNTSSNWITYFSRLNPLDGAIEKGQFVLTRLSSGKGNTIYPSAITADEQGNVYVAGTSAYQIANRDNLSINGQKLAGYAGGDPWVLAVPNTFSKRLLWTAPANGGQAAGLGVAATGGMMAFVAKANATPLPLVAPLQNKINPAKGSSAGYLMVLPGYNQ